VRRPFPDISPYSTGYLSVDHGHNIYWEQSGNPDGAPVIFLHGEPGGATAPFQRQFFDPDHYRIILFDQRGCGKSTPHLEMTANTPAHLVADIEAIRNHLSIDRWHVFGGSWGSTLALLYAAAHPENCVSLVLRGIFLMDQAEIDWFLYGMKHIFPEAWEAFATFIPEAERDNLLTAYHRRLTSNDPHVQLEAAMRWSGYEGACSSLLPKDDEKIETPEQKSHDLSIALIECDYFVHHVIPAERGILKSVDRFRHIPAVIVQGRYDIVCPPVTAHSLHLAWPEADFRIVPDGGHSSLDPAIRSALIDATEHVKTFSISTKNGEGRQ